MEVAGEAFGVGANAGLQLSFFDHLKVGVAFRSAVDLAFTGKANFEIPLIARIALGKHWRRTSQSDRVTYTAVFGEFLLLTYGSKLAAFERDKFEVVGAVPRGRRDIVVQTRISQPSGSPIKAGWRVRLFKGEPRIIDIVIEGVSMALNQRQEFASVLTRNGLGGLMEMLRARTQRLPVEGPRTAAAG